MAENKYEKLIKPRFKEIESWARDGMNEKDMAGRLGVGYSTFRVYKDTYEDFRSLLARTKDYVDLVEMVGAYKRRATGYDYTEVKTIYSVVNGEKVLREVQEIKKHVPGDPRAMENWLRLRQPKLWGAVQQQEREMPVFIMQEKERLIESDVVEEGGQNGINSRN